MYGDEVRWKASFALLFVTLLAVPSLARADDKAVDPTKPADATAKAPATEENLGKVDLSGNANTRAEAKPLDADADEAPPLPPRKKGLVLDSRIGVFGFTGELAQLATTAPYASLQLGYEIFDWLMVFGQAELALTTTGGDGKTRKRAFPIFGFGGGVRVTVHVTPRVALFLAPGIGAIVADVPERALAIYGYQDLESLGLSLNGRLGLEWYAVNRHFALGISGGPRFAPSLAKTAANASPGLAWDVGAGIRYTF